MTIAKTKIGTKGQIVIPKIFRDNLGVKEGGEVIMKLEKDELIITSTKKDIPKKWGNIAREKGANVRKEVLYGDKLYEEVL
ncbi:MAG: AbrB/MazE/SpoVT family DNA-binding domain-containing protein [Methanobacteriota archaeon]|nr:AbrB/MazE/SpoVT family DNA-binding domain-containing protein [Candidatus Hydrothermarchaeota archaeon]